MKTILAMLVLTVSVGAMAQERKLLDSKEISIDSNTAILVRTSSTPDKVTVNFKVPTEGSICRNEQRILIPRQCSSSRTVYETQRVCRDVVTTTPNSSTSSGPRGPRYNPGTTTTTTTTTRRVCNDVTVSRSVPYRYDCSYTETRCLEWDTISTGWEKDSVKIKFKDLPKLAGSEEETFLVKAEQRRVDGTNITYVITPVSTLNDREYEVESKGILGFDSYVIQSK